MRSANVYCKSTYSCTRSATSEVQNNKASVCRGLPLSSSTLIQITRKILSIWNPSAHWSSSLYTMRHLPQETRSYRVLDLACTDSSCGSVKYISRFQLEWYIRWLIINTTIYLSTCIEKRLTALEISLHTIGQPSHSIALYRIKRSVEVCCSIIY